MFKDVYEMERKSIGIFKNNKLMSSIFVKILVICLILNVSYLFTLDDNHIIKAAQDIEWDVTLDINDTYGAYSSIVFGESNNAKDGPTGAGPSGNDLYDEPLPPLGPSRPYIQAWFEDNLLTPFEKILKDYRKFPDTNKTWNLAIQYYPKNNSQTNITISWEINQLNNVEYDSIFLYNNNQTLLADILIDNSYTYYHSQNIPYNFQIICEGQISDNGKSNQLDNNLILIIIVASIISIVIIFSLYQWKIKK